MSSSQSLLGSGSDLLNACYTLLTALLRESRSAVPAAVSLRTASANATAPLLTEAQAKVLVRVVHGDLMDPSSGLAPPSRRAVRRKGIPDVVVVSLPSTLNTRAGVGVGARKNEEEKVAVTSCGYVRQRKYLQSCLAVQCPQGEQSLKYYFDRTPQLPTLEMRPFISHPSQARMRCTDQRTRQCGASASAR